jgi:hypothetical protein
MISSIVGSFGRACPSPTIPDSFVIFFAFFRAMIASSANIEDDWNAAAIDQLGRENQNADEQNYTADPEKRRG